MKLSTVAASALSLSVAVAALAGCSNGSQSAFTPPSGTASVPRRSTQSVRSQTTTLPFGAHCGKFTNIVYEGIAWYHDLSNGEWYEISGGWVGPPYMPCETGATIIAEQSNPPNWWWGSIFPIPNLPKKLPPKWVITAPASGTIVVVQGNPKHPQVIETISTPGSPVNVAVSKQGTTYVLTIPSPSGQTSQILVYPQGATTPSATLTDPGLGQNAGSIAVDEKGNAFVSYTESNGSQTSDQIDEFPAGSTTPQPFASIPGVEAGSLAATKKGDVVASSIGASSGQISIFSPAGGSPTGTFPTTSDPTSISLNRSNKELYVVDATNNLISTYTYPSGKLVVQGSFGSGSVTLVPASVSQP